MKKIIALLLIILTFTACVTETFVTIDSSESDTEITLDGAYLGYAPVSVEIGNEAWEEHQILAHKDGKQDVHFTVEKEIKVNNALLGFLIWWPGYLYAWGPKPYQYVNMR